MEEFEQFWKLYPRKIAKADARKAWAQTEKIRPKIAQLLQAVELQCKTEQWMKDGGIYIPYAATWLRGERWEDQVEVKLPGVVDGKLWHETWPGIVAKGLQLGIKESDFNHPQEFKAAVMRGSMKAA
jgi:hypothetical protein